MKRPNILLIMTDQHRWDALGCYGNSVIETPNLDWLAANGTIFESAYTPSPSCVPARTALLSGMSPWNSGVLGTGKGQGPMGGGFSHTLPGELAKGGYHTQGIGKMNFYPQRALNGFHHTVLDESERVVDPDFVSDYKQWFDAQKEGDYGIVDHGIGWNSWMARPFHAAEFLHPTNWTVNESLKFLKQRDPSKPFFLKTSFTRPHSPYDPPAYYYNLYQRDKEIPQPSVGEWAHVHDIPKDAQNPNAWRGVLSDEEIKRARAGYYGSIHHIDHQIGRLFAYLQSRKLFDEMMIVFTSDHGDMLGDHHLWRKTYGYEGSVHIPLLIKMPKSSGEANRIVKEPVLIQDIMPTLLDAAGLSKPSSVDGESLLPSLYEERRERRNYVHGEHSACYADEQEMHYLTDGRKKYIWFPRLGTEQFFDLTIDPYECTNLAERIEYEGQITIWRQRLVGVLAPRNAGLTKNNRLICQSGKPYLVSPHYKKRMEGLDLYRNYK